MNSSLVEEVPNSNHNISTNGTSLDDDYYSGEDDYEYKDEISAPSVNLTQQTPTTSASTSTSSSSTSATSTTTKSASDVETSEYRTWHESTRLWLTNPPPLLTDLLGLEDAPETATLQTCPLACHCEMGFVNCSGLQLSQIPSELPQNLVSLDLSSNQLEDLDLNALAQFKELQELNVSHNEIKQIQKLVGWGQGNLAIR